MKIEQQQRIKADFSLRQFLLVIQLSIGLVAVAGCSTTPEQRVERLPFHLAVVPARVYEALSEDDSGFDLQVRAGTLSEAIVKTLDGTFFTEATLLPYPEGMNRESFHSERSFDEQDQWWAQASRSIHADLILTPQLKYVCSVNHGINEKFWMNLPLYAFAVPLCLFVRDRTYFVVAELEVAVADLNPIYEKRTRLDSRAPEIISFVTRSPELSLSFVERAGKHVGRYLLAVLVPPGLVARESDHARLKLTERVVESLSDRMFSTFRERRDDIMESVEFYVDLDSVDIRKQTGGQVDFACDVILLSGRTIGTLFEYRMDLGDEEVLGDFEEPILDTSRSTERDRFLRYHIERKLPLTEATHCIRLKIVAQGKDRIVRSYTFAVPPLERLDVTD